MFRSYADNECGGAPPAVCLFGGGNKNKQKQSPFALAAAAAKPSHSSSALAHCSSSTANPRSRQPQLLRVASPRAPGGGPRSRSTSRHRPETLATDHRPASSGAKFQIRTVNPATGKSSDLVVGTFTTRSLHRLFPQLRQPADHPPFANPFLLIADQRLPALWRGFRPHQLHELKFKIVKTCVNSIAVTYCTPADPSIARALYAAYPPPQSPRQHWQPAVLDWWSPFVECSSSSWLQLPQSLVVYLPACLRVGDYIKFHDRASRSRADDPNAAKRIDVAVWTAAVRHLLALAALTNRVPDLCPVLEVPSPERVAAFERRSPSPSPVKRQRSAVHRIVVRAPDSRPLFNRLSVKHRAAPGNTCDKDYLPYMETQRALAYYGAYIPLPKGSRFNGDDSSKLARRTLAGRSISINRPGAKRAQQTGSGGTPTSKLSSASLSFPSSSDNLELEHMYAQMEKGCRVCRILPGKQWEPKHQWLCIKRETRQVLLFKEEASTRDKEKPLTMDLRQIKDVLSLDYRLRDLRIIQCRYAADRDVKDFPPDKILIISYGNAFNLKHLMLLFDVDRDVGIWKDGLFALAYSTLSAPYPLVCERWLRKQFYNISGNYSAHFVEQKHMKPFIQSRLQYKVSSEHLQAITQEKMTFDLFAAAYRQLVHVYALFSDNFSWLSSDGEQITFDQFLMFLRKIQNQASSDLEASEFLRNYISCVDPARDCDRPHLTVQEFTDFLFSPSNSLFDPAHYDVVDSMDEPLHYYWIASSHNTYLTGDQITSLSDLDTYARALLMGCRCIELDVWDPKQEGGDIVITHGHTLTSKVLVKDVLHVIKEFAFITSDLPVILSIEDNCSVPYQRTLANNLKQILGDLLLTTAVNKNEKLMPSPSAMRGRIIVKHKKLPSSDTPLAIVTPLTAEEQDMFSEPEHIKQGVLWMWDRNRWVQRLFALTADRLTWSAEDMSAGKPPDDTTSTGSAADNDEENASLLGRPEDMHMTEDWFHGLIDHRRAEQLLMAHKELGDGLFLVRGSARLVGEFTVSFLRKGTVNHLRISSKLIKGEKKYYYNEAVQKDTVYELVSYYQHHPLWAATGRSTGDQVPRGFEVQLKTPCPQPTPHVGQPWYAGEITREEADELLMSYPENGAFLFRKSGQDSSVFVLTWWVDDEIKHMRLKTEGRMFVVHNTFYESLNAIVDEFATRELFHGVCLRHPVNKDSISHYASATRLHDQVASSYMELNAEKTQVRALMAYQGQGRDANHLSFPANAIITVSQKHSVLWYGTYQGKSGWFPASMVTEAAEATAGAQFDKSISLTHCVVDNLRRSAQDRDADAQRQFTFVLRKAADHWHSRTELNEVRLACDTVDDMSDWLNTLRETIRAAFDKAEAVRSKEKVLKIASELSDLVVYCQAVPYNPHNIPGPFYQMCSFSENKFKNLINRGLVSFNRHQISRAYPKAQRVYSTNFEPTPFWMAGVQMVALNYQTADRAMQLNQGRFVANGRCGYVLKPAYMRHDGYDVDRPESSIGNQPVTLTITVMAGRHLDRRYKDRVSGTSGIVSPVVEVEIVGLACDAASMKTKTVTSDGLHPIWNETFEFSVQYPELALMRVSVEDGDFVRSDPFIGQSTLPLSCIRNGFRSVQLQNPSSEELELSALLLYVNRQSHSTSSLPGVSSRPQLGNGQSSHNSDDPAAAANELDSSGHSNDNSFASPAESVASSVRSPLTREFSKDSQNSAKTRSKKVSLTKSIGKLFSTKKSSTFD